MATFERSPFVYLYEGLFLFNFFCTRRFSTLCHSLIISRIRVINRFVESRQADVLGFEYRCHNQKGIGSSANIRFCMQNPLSRCVKICFTVVFSTLHRCEAVFAPSKSILHLCESGFRGGEFDFYTV